MHQRMREKVMMKVWPKEGRKEEAARTYKVENKGKGEENYILEAADAWRPSCLQLFLDNCGSSRRLHPNCLP
jgi:hypothetical protein